MNSELFMSLIQKYGTSFTIDDKEVKAFIQPLKYHHKLYLKELPENYFRDSSFFICVLSSDITLEEYQVISSRNNVYSVVSSGSQDDLYVWAVLKTEVKIDLIESR